MQHSRSCFSNSDAAITLEHSKGFSFALKFYAFSQLCHLSNEFDFSSLLSCFASVSLTTLNVMKVVWKNERMDECKITAAPKRMSFTLIKSQEKYWHYVSCLWTETQLIWISEATKQLGCSQFSRYDLRQSWRSGKETGMLTSFKLMPIIWLYKYIRSPFFPPHT